MEKYTDIVKVCWNVSSALNIRSYTSYQTYKLGDPTMPDTNLGPVVSVASAERIRKQITDAGMCHSSSTPRFYGSCSPCWCQAVDS